MKKGSGAEGFAKEYWDKNYSSPDDMDGIGNVSSHLDYIRSLFEIEFIDISSIADFGFGLGHLFEAVLDHYKPYKALGIEPSRHPFDIVKKRKIKPVPSTKLSLKQIDLVGWCKENESKKIRFDLGLCTSVFQYLTDEEMEYCLRVLSMKVKYLYFSVPTDIELRRQVEDLEFEWPLLFLPSLKNEKPFIEVLHEILRSKSLEVKEQTNDLKVPQTESAYRLFHVNYMNASYSNGQVLLEFFLVSPELISSLSQGYKPRENSRVKNIISIIGSLPVMTSFLDAFGSCIKEEIKYDE